MAVLGCLKVKKKDTPLQGSQRSTSDFHVHSKDSKYKCLLDREMGIFNSLYYFNSIPDQIVPDIISCFEGSTVGELCYRRKCIMLL